MATNPAEEIRKREGEKGPWMGPNNLWYASPLNFCDKVRATMPNLPKRVYFRQYMRGEEESGHYDYLLTDKVMLACMTSDIGIKEIDTGSAAHPYYRRSCAAIREAFDGTERSEKTDLMLIVSGPTLKDYIRQVDWAVESGADVLEIKGSAEHDVPLQTDVIEYIKKKTDKPFTVILQSISRETENSIAEHIKYLKAAIKVGGDRLIRVITYDMIGCGTPTSNKYSIELLKKGIGNVPILWHCHDDFGMATANAMAGVEAGASWLDVTCNGTGDRAGAIDIAEAAMALKCLYAVETGITTEGLYNLSKFHEKITGKKIELNKAIVGDFAYREDGHTGGLVQRRKEGTMWRMHVYDPVLVGQSGHRWVYGKATSNPSAIKWLLDDMGLKYTEEDVDELVWAVANEIDRRIIAGMDNRWLEDDEIRDLLQRKLIQINQIKAIKKG